MPGGRVVAAAEGVGVAGGELTGASEEVVDDLKLVICVGGEQFAGLADEVAEDLLVAGGGGCGGLDHKAAPVAGVGPAADVAGPFEAVQHGGDAAGGEAEQLSQGSSASPRRGSTRSVSAAGWARRSVRRFPPCGPGWTAAILC